MDDGRGVTTDGAGPSWGRRLGRAAEGVTLILAVGTPWAFGSVEASAELGIVAGVALLILLGVARAAAGGPVLPLGRRLRCGPSVALGGLALLALLQATPLPGGLVARLDPAGASRLAALVAGGSEAVAGDPGPPIAPAAPTLSQDRDASLQAAARLAAAWLLLQAILALGGAEAGMARRLGGALVANAALLALVALLQALTWRGKLLWLRPYPGVGPWSAGGPFVCHTHLAEVLNLGLGCALGTLLAGPPRQRPWAAYAAGVIVAGLVTSHSRGGVLGLFVGLTLALALAGSARRVRVAGWGLPGLAAAMGLLGLLLAVIGDAVPYRARLATLLDTGDVGYTRRIEVWSVALWTFAQHPLLGTGLGSFPVATAPGFDRDAGAYFARAENEPIDLLTEGGLVGLGLGLVGVAGVVRLVRRARSAATAPGDRAFVLGGAAGLAALAVQLGSDFGLHVPGVAVPAAVLIAHLARLGIAAPGAPAIETAASRPRRAAALAFGAACLALAVGLVVNATRNARLEAALVAAGVPAPGDSQPTLADPPGTDQDLDRARLALEAATRLRPGWAEGYFRLGLVHRALYRREAAAALAGQASEAEVAALADPAHLLGLATAPDGPLAATLLEHDAIRSHLVPAARAFLLARRACPRLAPAHGGLAEVAYLLTREPDPAAHATRALSLSGNDLTLLGRLALVGVQVGDRDLAARAWGRALRLDPPEAEWEAVADAALAALAPDRVLAIAPDARAIVRLADRLPKGPDRDAWRVLYFRQSLERLPAQEGLAPAERLALEAHVRAGLDDRIAASRLLDEALRLDPTRADWRAEGIAWALRWGEPARARDAARTWLRLAPGDGRARRAWEQAVAATARGG